MQNWTFTVSCCSLFCGTFQDSDLKDKPHLADERRCSALVAHVPCPWRRNHQRSSTTLNPVCWHREFPHIWTLVFPGKIRVWGKELYYSWKVNAAKPYVSGFLLLRHHKQHVLFVVHVAVHWGLTAAAGGSGDCGHVWPLSKQGLVAITQAQESCSL